MPATTPHGLPYPLGTDRVADGDDAIHNLATALDRVAGTAAGTSGIPISAASLGSVAVTLPAGRFLAAPAITATIDTSTLVFPSVMNITTTGFTLSGRVYTGTITATVQCQWIATEKG